MSALENHLRAAAIAAKAGDVSLDKATTIVEQAYGVRRINGFVVNPGFRMPEPPEPGLLLWVTFHGGDGLEYFWAPDTGGDGFDYKAWEKSWQYMEFCDLDLDEPFDRPDTGGSGYKDCQDAFSQLGFSVW